MNKMQAVTVEETEAKPTKKKRIIVQKKRWGVLLSIPLILLAIGLYWWMTSGSTVGTDNAAVKQDIVSVSAQVNGPISEVDVKNGDDVKRGDVLFRIDPEPFQVALEQAEAQLAAARLQTSQLRLVAVCACRLLARLYRQQEFANLDFIADPNFHIIDMPGYLRNDIGIFV